MVGNYLPTDKWNKNIWQYLAERLAQNGWQVLTTSSIENQALRLLDMLWTILTKRRDYKLAQIDVFSGTAFIFAEACTWLLNKLHKPVVLTLHGGRLPEFSQQDPKRFQRLLSSARVVVTPSPFIQLSFSSFRPDIRLIPNPVNLNEAIFRIRAKPTPNLIWVRAFHSLYNPAIVPEMIEALEPEFPDIHLFMLGPDKGDGSLNHMLTLAKDLDVYDKIEVVGMVPHHGIPKWLDKADIFINTTNYDNAPRSVIEAMANGLCVVSTNVGGIPYIIDDGISGLLVPPKDPKQMAMAVRRVLNQPSLAGELSRNAREKAEHYSWNDIMPQWENLLTEIINDGLSQ